MLISEEILRQYINDGPCYVHDAVCLIHGIDPEQMVKKGEYSHYDVSFTYNLVEFNPLLKALCGKRYFWDVRDNIFSLVNKALQNNIEVNEVLLKLIGEYIDNLISEDVHSFAQKFLYLMKKIRPAAKEITTNSSSQFVTTEERSQKFTSMAGEIWGKDPKKTKAIVAQEIYEWLAKHEPQFLRKADGGGISTQTIERNIKKVIKRR